MPDDLIIVCLQERELGDAGCASTMQETEARAYSCSCDGLL